VDRAAAEAWIRSHVEPVGPIELTYEEPWSTVLRVPLADDVAWFKECSAVQAFEPRLTSDLFRRWGDRVPEVLGFDAERAWLLLADAGQPLRMLGNPPECWLAVLPRYAELQRGEALYLDDHVRHGVPDMRVATLPAHYEVLLQQQDLPLLADEIGLLRSLQRPFARLCEAVAADGFPPTIQHDDLHFNNVFEREGHLRVLDWGDSSIGHPFASLVVTFRFLEQFNHLLPGDPWFARLRDAYLEVWGRGLVEAFDLAMRVGKFAHALAVIRQRVVLPPERRPEFDIDFAVWLRRALSGF
jgi:hypothetical protein